VNPAANGNPQGQAPPSAAPDRSARPREDPEVVRALEEYLAALEAGVEPDREEFLARHPAVAATLADCLEGLEFIRAAAFQVREPAGGGPASPPPGATDFHPEAPLGDYRIVREVGRGGMGVVYEAVQLSLGRRVALKVLPFAAALDPRQLGRFHNEAQAAARLHHSNIVPVFGVGCERGLHFYAMQFIDGQTLAALIRDLRRVAGLGEAAPAPGAAPARPEAGTTPRVALATERSVTAPAHFRRAAQLGIQAADALEHAHRLGVVHRDVKPANLLLDGRGNLWVTDFGLAQFHGDAALTRTGDLVGTLRYMSPEQARARHALVDERTDVYSLGATLYELLTLEPAFAAADRHELLAQIASEEPRPLRRLNPAVPAELETVVLKAMEKDPAERYATAGELADDLRRFLEDRPVRARRATLLQRARKWSRRHRTLVAAAAGVLLVATVAAALSTALVWRAKERAEEAARATAVALRAEAGQRRRAEDRERFAREAAEDLYAQGAEKLLAHRPHMELKERAFLERVLRFYQELSKEQGSDPAIRMETGRAHRRVGTVQHKLGRHAEAEQAYRRAIKLLEPLAASPTSAPVCRYELARSLIGLGDLLLSISRPREAEQAVRRSLALYKGLREQVAKDPALLGQMRPGLLLGAEEVGRQPPALPARLAKECSRILRNELAANYTSLGLALGATGRARDAEEAYQQALALQEELADEAPANADYRHALACTHYNRGELLRSAGQWPKAEQAYGRALALFEKLADDAPAIPVYRHGLAGSRHGLGVALAETGRLAQAEKALRQALELQQRLASDFPALPAYRYSLAVSHNSLGIVLWAAGRHADVEKAFRQSHALLEQLADGHPAVPEYRHQLARTSFNLGSLLEARGRPGDAERPLRQAAALYEKLSADSPRDVRPERAANLNALALVLKNTGRAGEARPLYQQAIALWEKLAADSPQEPAHRSNLGGGLSNLARLLNAEGEWAQARPLLEQAVRHQKAALQQRPGNPVYRRLLRGHYLLLAETLRALGEDREADRARAEAAALPPPQE
jgi:serine/threonine protein kinase